MKELQVEIISPAGFLFNGKCHLAAVPAASGVMGVMADHEAVLANLIPGKITIFDDKQNIVKEFDATSGFAEVFDSKLLILVD